MLNCARNILAVLIASSLAIPCAMHPAAAQSPLDGRWRGQRTPHAGNSPNCGAAATVTWEFIDGSLVNFFNHKRVPMEFAPDGTFSAFIFRLPGWSDRGPVYTTVRVSGRIEGDRMLSSWSNRYCGHDFVLNKLPPK